VGAAYARTPREHQRLVAWALPVAVSAVLLALVVWRYTSLGVW